MIDLDSDLHPVLDPTTSNISNDLKDKCAAVQLKLRIDDQKWREMFGNDSGLYGLVIAYIQQECLKTRLDEMARLIMDKHYVEARKRLLINQLTQGEGLSHDRPEE